MKAKEFLKLIFINSGILVFLFIGGELIARQFFPELKGNLSAISIRVPTPNVSIIDFVAKLSTKVSLDELNHAFVNSSQGSLRDYLDIAPEGAVSIDLLRNKHSAVFDPFGSRVIGDDFIKVIAWYDNEYGYSSRVLDLASKIGKLL